MIRVALKGLIQRKLRALLTALAVVPPPFGVKQLATTRELAAAATNGVVACDPPPLPVPSPDLPCTAGYSWTRIRALAVGSVNVAVTELLALGSVLFANHSCTEPPDGWSARPSGW